ncbi:hypothetical protein BGZ95_007349, partial [Linnemannia exigua]
PTSESVGQAAIRIGHGKTERTEDGDDGEVVSAAVVTDRRPLIAVPILVQMGAQGQEVGSASSSGDGRVRFELDHQVPPLDVLLQETAQTRNVRRAEPATAVDQQQQQEAPAKEAAEGKVVTSEKAGGTVENDGAKGTENPAVAVDVPPSQDAAAPPVHLAETLQDAVTSSDKATPASKSNTEAISVATTSETTPSDPNAQVHPESKPEGEAHAVAQDPVAQSTPEIKAESPKAPEETKAPSKANQPSSAPAVDLNLLDADPNVHAIFDASAQAFGSPQIPPPTYASVIDSEEGSAEAGGPPVKSEEQKKEEQDATQAESEVVDGMAKVLFDQYRAKIEAELESYKSKVSPNDGQAVFEVETVEVSIIPPTVDVDPLQDPSSADDKKEEEKKKEEVVDVVGSTGGTPVKLNRLNKNHGGYDDSQETTSSEDLKPQILVHHHHHHLSNGSPKQQPKQEAQQQTQEQEPTNNDNVIVANDDRPLEFLNPVQEVTPVIHQQQQLDQ